MDTFAFIIHPIDPKRDVSRKFPLLGRVLNERQIDFFSTFFPPVFISEIEGITSEETGKEIKGWFLACPYTPKRMLELSEGTVYRKIIQTGRMAEKLGAQQVFAKPVPRDELLQAIALAVAGPAGQGA